MSESVQHTPGPISVDFDIEHKEICRPGLEAGNDETLVLFGYTDEPDDQCGIGLDTPADSAWPTARLLAAAYTSYDRHCGPNAVKAAEDDLLGKALSICKDVIEGAESVYATNWHLMAEVARSVLAAAKGGEA